MSRAAAVSRFLSLRLRTGLAYRGDLLAQVLADGLSAGIGLVFLAALFQRIPDLAGWAPHEVLLVWGVSECAVSLAACLFAGASHFNRRYLVGGELDRVLLRPMHPWLQVLLEHVGVQGLGSGVLGCGMVAWALSGVSVAEPARLGLLLFVVPGGALLLGAMQTAACALGFATRHRGSLVGLLQQGAAFGRYPLDAFPQALRRLLVFVVPVGLISAVPVAWALGRPAPTLLAVGQPVLGLLAFSLATAFWTRMSRRYGSAGT